jgi:hypothetical protein
MALAREVAAARIIRAGRKATTGAPASESSYSEGTMHDLTLMRVQTSSMLRERVHRAQLNVAHPRARPSIRWCLVSPLSGLIALRRIRCTSLRSHPLSSQLSVNYNAAPTSMMPVWRVQTASEVHELKAAGEAHHEEVAAAASMPNATPVAEVLAEVPADAHSGASAGSQSVVQYMSFGHLNPVRTDGSNPMLFNARSETVEDKVSAANQRA